MNRGFTYSPAADIIGGIFQCNITANDHPRVNFRNQKKETLPSPFIENSYRKISPVYV